jgi:hypothetical protein
MDAMYVLARLEHTRLKFFLFDTYHLDIVVRESDMSSSIMGAKTELFE